MALTYTVDGEKTNDSVRVVYGTWAADATLTYGAVHLGVTNQFSVAGAATTATEVTVTGTGIGTGVTPGMHVDSDAWAVGLMNTVSAVPDADTIVLAKAAPATASVGLIYTQSYNPGGLIGTEVTNSVSAANTTAHGTLNGGGTVVITSAASDAGQWAVTLSR